MLSLMSNICWCSGLPPSFTLCACLPALVPWIHRAPFPISAPDTACECTKGAQYHTSPSLYHREHISLQFLWLCMPVCSISNSSWHQKQWRLDTCSPRVIVEDYQWLLMLLGVSHWIMTTTSVTARLISQNFYHWPVTERMMMMGNLCFPFDSWCFLFSSVSHFLGKPAVLISDTHMCAGLPGAFSSTGLAKIFQILFWFAWKFRGTQSITVTRLVKLCSLHFE